MTTLRENLQAKTMILRRIIDRTRSEIITIQRPIEGLQDAAIISDKTKLMKTKDKRLEAGLIEVVEEEAVQETTSESHKTTIAK